MVIFLFLSSEYNLFVQTYFCEINQWIIYILITHFMSDHYIHCEFSDAVTEKYTDFCNEIFTAIFNIVKPDKTHANIR